MQKEYYKYIKLKEIILVNASLDKFLLQIWNQDGYSES
jgi:hypothetical protein